MSCVTMDFTVITIPVTCWIIDNDEFRAVTVDRCVIQLSRFPSLTTAFLESVLQGLFIPCHYH